MTRELSLRDWSLLFVVALALFLPGFASLPPVDRDEGRYVVSSQRMADTGDRIDIRYQDQPRYLQPVGIYWLQSTAAALLDGPEHDSIWAYRIPSLLGALIAIALAGWIGAFYFGRGAGLTAALLLAACFSLNFEARIAKTDAVLLASIVAAQLALMRAYTEPASGRAMAALFWAALGIGLLVKGPLILIVVGATIVALVAWDRKVSWLLRLRPLWGPLLTLAIAVPWYVAIGVITDGAFYAKAVGQSLMGKVANSQQGHSGPPGYHLALFALAFWPGSLLAASAVPFAWRARAQPAVRFLLCWIIPTWVVFELVATKLPHYVLPTYPAIACLAGAALFDPNPAPIGRLGRLAFVGVSLLWLGVSALLASAGPIALWRIESVASPIAIALGALGFAAACAALVLLSRRRKGAAIAAFVLAGALVLGNTFGYAAPRLEQMWMSPRIEAAVRLARPCENGSLVTTPYHEPSLVFLHGRTSTILAPSGAAAAQALASDSACGLALVGAVEEADFLARAARLGLDVAPMTRILGQNYSNGDELSLTLYRAVRAHEDESGAR